MRGVIGMIRSCCLRRDGTALPGRSLEGDPNGYPSKDEIADYLQAYVTDFDLPVQLGTSVQALETAGARYQIRTDQA